VQEGPLQKGTVGRTSLGPTVYAVEYVIRRQSDADDGATINRAWAAREDLSAGLVGIQAAQTREKATML
jgi:hypothetical protein